MLSAIFTNYTWKKRKSRKQTFTALRQNSTTSQEQTTAIHCNGFIYNTMEHYAYNKPRLILFLLNSHICYLVLFFFFFNLVQCILLCVSTVGQVWDTTEPFACLPCFRSQIAFQIQDTSQFSTILTDVCFTVHTFQPQKR